MVKTTRNTPYAKKKESEETYQENTRIDRRLKIETRFGYAVRKYRIEGQLTQADLAHKCKYHQNYISDIESGKRNVTLRVAETVAKALGVQVKDLLT